jgi:uncharacterized protein YjdB
VIVSLAIFPGTLTLAPGTSGGLTGNPTSTGCLHAPDRVQWTSGNPAVATVQDVLRVPGNQWLDASVTGVAQGTAVITGTASACTNPMNGGTTQCVGGTEATKVASITVTVAGPPATMAITPAAPQLLVNGTLQLGMDFKDQNGLSTTGNFANITWSIPAGAVASISTSGLLTAGANLGTATVTASYPGIPNATTTVTVTGVPAHHITVAPAAASVQVNASLPALVATVRDVANNPLPGRGVTWISLQPGIATVGLATGIVTGVAPGTATIRALADENQSVFGDATVTVTPAPPGPALIAHALANQPTTAAYTPASQFNGQGGPITIQRQSTGRYIVTIPGFGGGSADSRIPIVNTVQPGGAYCATYGALGKWTMVGVTDATVRVECYTLGGGSLVDAGFTLFAAGQGGLPGAFAFAFSGNIFTFPASGNTISLPAADAWSSSTSPTLTRDAVVQVGRYSLRLHAQAGVPSYAPVLGQSATGSRCHLGSWTGTQDVLCYGIIGFADAPFTGMLIEQGRPGKRFGAQHSNSNLVSRNSAGGTNTVTAGMVSQVTFPGLATPPGGSETVLVTAHNNPGVSLYCHPAGWTSVGADLVVNVTCYDGTGSAVIAGPGTPRAFIVVVIE